MFGDYGIYSNGKIFGLICDDRFYLKSTKVGRNLLQTIEMRQPYDGARDEITRYFIFFALSLSKRNVTGMLHLTRVASPSVFPGHHLGISFITRRTSASSFG